jgi:UDP-GlcNAc:undecaprenyl-phosphate/decaprenyl-phosphate GlcNAc-1-phosphate transferase
VPSALLLVTIPAVVGFGVALATAPAWERRLRGRGWIDLPRPDRHAKRPVSRAGGAVWLSGLLAGIAAGIVAATGVPGRAPRSDVPGLAGALAARAPTGFTTALVGSGIVGLVACLAFVLGRLDDRGLVGPGRKWALQVVLLACGVLGLLLGSGWRGSALPAGSPPGPVAAFPAGCLLSLGVAFAVGVVLQIALEILDHLDGLLAVQAAAGAAALALAAGPGWARDAGLAACGASLGFLCWNRPPARLYLGNAGSLAVATVLPLVLLGVALSGGSVLKSGGGPNPGGPLSAGAADLTSAAPWRFAMVLPVFAWPLLDLAVVTGARLRRGDPPWRGGRDHLAHRLARRLGSDRASFAAAAAAAAAGFLLAATGLR